MARQTKMLAVKAEDMSSIPKNHAVGENYSCKLSRFQYFCRGAFA